MYIKPWYTVILILIECFKSYRTNNYTFSLIVYYIIYATSNKLNVQSIPQHDLGNSTRLYENMIEFTFDEDQHKGGVVKIMFEMMFDSLSGHLSYFNNNNGGHFILLNYCFISCVNIHGFPRKGEFINCKKIGSIF